MKENRSADSWEWEPLVAAGDWDAIDNWWRSKLADHPDGVREESRDDGRGQGTPAIAEDDLPACRALLSALRAIVPTILVQNGTEQLERHLRVEDDQAEWSGREDLRGAAAILELGELEAAVEGDPAPASVAWADLREQVHERLREMARHEPTTGAEELSRAAHIEQAFGLLHRLDALEEWMCGEMETPEDRDWLRDVVSETALLAFDAGRRAQLASGKSFERLAARRMRQIRNFAGQNEGRREVNRARQEQSKARKQHAGKVASARCGDLRRSELARCILRNWDKVGEADKRPTPPALKTIQNWLSKEK